MNENRSVKNIPIDIIDDNLNNKGDILWLLTVISGFHQQIRTRTDN